jgi:type I restriction enzyme S subunit
VILKQDKLPENWKVKRLDEVAEIIMGQSPPSNTYNTDGRGLPFFQGKAEFGELYPTATKYCTAPKKLAEKNDILLSVRAPVGPVNIANSDCCIGRGLAAIRANRELLNYKFLYLYMKLIEGDISGKGRGSTFTAIRGKVVKAIQIPLPPLETQNKLVKKLDSFFEDYNKIKEEQKEIGDIIKALPYSVLAKAFNGEL